jgi:RNA recognition motif-containing protein
VRLRRPLWVSVRLDGLVEEALMGKKLYVGNLSYSTTDSDLEQMFAAHGTVQ